jgi:hypothetical protein
VKVLHNFVKIFDSKCANNGLVRSLKSGYLIIKHDDKEANNSFFEKIFVFILIYLGK